ncbi:MAG: DUF3103 family protein [Trueperaceae bacterium]
MKHLKVSKRASSIFILIFLLFLGACSTSTPETTETPEVTEIPEPVDVGDKATTEETMNTSLETLAQLFAKATTDSSVREHIQQEVAKRFDGDTNVLYTSLVAAQSQLQAQGSTVDIRQALANAYPSGEGLSSQDAGALETVDQLTNSIPRLQVAVPEHFETWDAKSFAPLVAYLPVDADDLTIKEIKAFDSAGNVHTLDAQTPPTQPILILSQNERTDDAGQLLHESESLPGSENPEIPAGELTAQANRAHQVNIGTVELNDRKEPWVKGDPEVWLIAQNVTDKPGFRTQRSFSAVNEIGYPYNYGGDANLGVTRYNVVFYWYEKDGSSLDLTLSAKGISLGIKIDDSDDIYGSTIAEYHTFAGSTSTTYDLDSLIFTAR